MRNEWWQNKVSHRKDSSATRGMTGKANPCKEERRKKNGDGETKFRILILHFTFYILLSTFCIDTVISAEAERS